MEMLEQREALARGEGGARLATRACHGRGDPAALDGRSRRRSRRGLRTGDAASLVVKLGELRFYRRFLDEVSAIEDELAA